MTDERDGKGYIDIEAVEAVPADAPWDDNNDNGSDSDDGSSIVESLESDREDHGGWPVEGGGVQGPLEPEVDDEDLLEWGVEDEDWELADGDFTKQYNRVRQSYAAADGGPSTSTARPLPARNANAANSRAAKKHAAPAHAGTTGKALVNPGVLGGVSANPKSAADRANTKDKADRATHEQVLDARTRLVLSALVNRGFFGVIDGVVSTGKEANVYLAYPGPNPPPTPVPYPSAVAVKIYRTSILNFRARQNYIVGEHRFKGGYSSAKNPRKMVRLWAEKELRNLRRLVQGGIRAPIVIEQRENVLVMEFLGKEGTASPRLKDADISTSKLPRLYGELLVAMRRMFHVCRLVHADLSEYNILYHASHLFIIDVSQSVEQEHPSAFDFLRSDIRNVEDFFVKRSNGEVRTLGLRRAWSFIVDASVGLTAEEEAGDAGEDRLLDILRTWLDRPEPAPEPCAEGEGEGEGEGGATAAQQNQNQVDDAVFFSSYIPRSLGEVYDPERDVDLLKSGQGDTLIYASLTGLDIHDNKAAIEEPEVEAVEPEVELAGKSKGKKGKGKKAKADVAENQADKPVIGEVSAEATTEPHEAAPTTQAPAEAPDAPAPAPTTPPPSLAPMPRSALAGTSPKKGMGVRWEDEEPAAEGDEEDDEEDDEEGEGEYERRSRGFRHVDKEDKKARKKALKEETREKRKTKMPKATKARLIKKSSGK